MARSDHDESPRSSRRSRKTSRNIPPPAPEVDWTRSADEEPESPRRRWRPERERYRDRDRERDTSRHRDSDWERRQDEEALLRTPESRTSSSSYHLSRRYHDAGSRRERDTTPSRSVASSMTSVPTPHPPRSSMTRQANVIYRRPSVTIRDTSPARYEEETPRESRRGHSQTRSIHVVPISHVSRRPSRTLQVPVATSSSENDDYTEDPYESHGDRSIPRRHMDTRLIRAEESDDVYGDRREPRGYRETRLVRVERDDRSPSREDIRSRNYRPIPRARSVRSLEEDRDEIGSRHMPPREEIDEKPMVRTMSRPVSRSRSQPASIRHVPDPESDYEHDADSDEPPARELRDRFEPRKPQKHRHGPRASRDQGRSRSENHSRRSPPSKRYVLSSALLGVDSGSSRRARPSSSKLYYESEAVVALDKQKRRHPPSASVRRSNTVVGSGSAAASQHHSVSPSTRRSSTFLGSFFGSSLPGYSHHTTLDKPVKLYDCVICMDELPARKMAKLKCGHRMCNSCLKRSFKLSVTDPQHMPPRCCTAEHIPLKHVERLFDISFKKTWNKKFAEFTARNRIYCPRRNCGEFIRPVDIRHNDGRKYGKCPKCSTKVCVRCSSRLHRERDCPKDEETMQILAKAKEEGWQRCFKCKTLVELQEGCNHMTCRCGAEFCYVCGVKWKSCSCPWFNYETVENDRLQHIPIPVPIRERLGDHTTVELPPSPRRESRPYLRSRPLNYEEELSDRRLQEERDEAYARHLQHNRDFDDDFVGGFGDVNGIGNAAGHFMNEDFRPRARPRNIAVPPQPPPPPAAPHPPPMPPEPAPMVFERPQQAGDYVQGVNRARGVRATSMTRLADRFNADLRSSPTRPTHAPRVGRPPPLQPSATMPPPAMAPPPALAPGPPIRRHATEEIGMRSVERPSGRITRPVVYEEPEERSMEGPSRRIARPVVYEEPEDIAPPHGMTIRKQHVKDPPRTPRQSAMAGLTGDERYRGRVDEWRRYVADGEASELASSV